MNVPVFGSGGVAYRVAYDVSLGVFPITCKPYDWSKIEVDSGTAISLPFHNPSWPTTVFQLMTWGRTPTGVGQVSFALWEEDFILKAALPCGDLGGTVYFHQQQTDNFTSWTDRWNALHEQFGVTSLIEDLNWWPMNFTYPLGVRWGNLAERTYGNRPCQIYQYPYPSIWGDRVQYAVDWRTNKAPEPQTIVWLPPDSRSWVNFWGYGCGIDAGPNVYIYAKNTINNYMYLARWLNVPFVDGGEYPNDEFEEQFPEDSQPYGEDDDGGDAGIAPAMMLPIATAMNLFGRLKIGI